MIKIGNYVTRNSYKNDTVFKVINRKKDILILKGVEYRLYADAPVSDCVLVDKNEIKDDFKPRINDSYQERNDYFYLIGKILHLDGDETYLKRCIDFYKNNNVYAVGKRIDEKTISSEIKELLEEIKPDIVVITGHDAYYHKNGNKKNLKNYQNSENFVKAVQEARKYEKDHNKLIIIAGACQSAYEELIRAGANFASSPKRINIHALDPAIIAVTLATTSRTKEIDLLDMLSKTKNGKDGMGGLICNGTMYVGYPR